MRLNVDLTEVQEQELAAIAERLRIAPDVLAAAALRDLLGQADTAFDAVADLVLTKNAELYRRLA